MNANYQKIAASYAVLLASLLSASHAQAPSYSGSDLTEMQVRRVFSGLSFASAVFLTHAGDGSDRIFVVEKAGRIKVFPHRDDVQTAKIFLDIRSRVSSGPAEAGLLSVTFHPDFVRNGKFYVYYNHGSLVSRVSEFRVSANPDTTDPDSERLLLEVSQPADNHNGGQLAFGPDGYLYIGLGDGGDSGNGQKLTTLLGAILRIDVDHSSDAKAYAIPADNPFVGNEDDWREEIWAWGLRNPWRFSFDRRTGDLWTGDVGASGWEEVDLIEKGKNYGWNIMEGFHCFQSSSNCSTEGLTMPIVEYGHIGSAARSITGGYVYRGPRLPRLSGVYLYGDYISRRIWGLRYAEGQVFENKGIARSLSRISSFGEDELGEVYIVGFDGRIYILDERPDDQPTGVERINDILPPSFTLAQNFPNPFNSGTLIHFGLPEKAEVELAVYNLLGQKVATLVSGVREAGQYTVQWNGHDERGHILTSGVYLYRLRGGEQVETRKLLLLQ